MTLSTEQGFPQWLAAGTIFQGWALAERGEHAEAIIQMRQGMTAWGATGAEVLQPYFLAQLAAAYGHVGHAEEGLHILADVVATVTKTGEGWYEAELHRLTGELLLVRSAEHRGEAEACFQQALDVARRQQAKSLELRAMMSSSRLWQKQDKKEEARQMLAEIYGWFTEGFGTKDLQEAKRLIEELS